MIDSRRWISKKKRVMVAVPGLQAVDRYEMRGQAASRPFSASVGVIYIHVEAMLGSGQFNCQ